MKILILNGSPRPKGNTARMAESRHAFSDQFLKEYEAETNGRVD